MKLQIRSRAGRLTLAAAALAALVAPLAVPAAEAHSRRHHDHELTVMTRNIYLGADIQRPLRAVGALPPGSDPATVLVALANANAQTRAIVDATKFPVRARLLAKEFAEQKPDLISLQEVALWRHGPLELDPANLAVPNAETVDLDYLQILLDAMDAQGLHYDVAKVQYESDVEAPSFVGIPPAIANPQDVRLTMRDVILIRDRHGLDLVRTGGGNYSLANTLQIPIAGKNMVFTRGYAWADVRVDHKKVRFIDTHLEAFGSNFALGQAQELLAGPASVPGRTTVIACDCNSDPLNTDVSNGVEHRAPYDFIVSQGFADQWLRWASAEEGFTSGFNELVNDPTNAAIDHRIDMIFARTPHGKPVRVTDGAVTGTAMADRDPVENIWPSDHGGVVLTLRLGDGRHGHGWDGGDD